MKERYFTEISCSIFSPYITSECSLLLLFTHRLLFLFFYTFMISQQFFPQNFNCPLVLLIFSFVNVVFLGTLCKPNKRLSDIRHVNRNSLFEYNMRDVIWGIRISDMTRSAMPKKRLESLTKCIYGRRSIQRHTKCAPIIFHSWENDMLCAHQFFLVNILFKLIFKPQGIKKPFKIIISPGMCDFRQSMKYICLDISGTLRSISWGRFV